MGAVQWGETFAIYARTPSLRSLKLYVSPKMSFAYVKGLVESGHLAGDPERIGEMFWASTHGCIVLEMTGKLPPGGARKLIGEVNSAISRGLRPQS